MKTLNFNLKNGMDSMVRVLSLLRRKGFNIKQINMYDNTLVLSIAEEDSMYLINNVNKLADVDYIVA